MSEHSALSVIDETTIQQRVHEFILTKLLAGEDPVNLTATTPLVSGGVIDSLNAMKVGLFLEKTFHVRITPEELANPQHMETIAAICALVTGKLRKGE